MLDLALVLAVDCSSSVDAGDYKLQMQGIAPALRNPALYEAIASGPYGRIGLALVHWSTANRQSVAIGWSSIASPTDLESVARQAESAERKWQAGRHRPGRRHSLQHRPVAKPARRGLPPHHRCLRRRRGK